MIYTKTGDQGKTSLIGGTRVSKADLRIETYGTIDELNSFIGLLVCGMADAEEKQMLFRIQNKLFTIGSYFATDTSRIDLKKESILKEKDVKDLENSIDKLEGKLPQMRRFVIPGGNRSAATAHICRTICRRAERLIYRLEENNEVDALVKAYINRLSDYLFLVARNECFVTDTGEIYWDNL